MEGQEKKGGKKALPLGKRHYTNYLKMYKKLNNSNALRIYPEIS